MNCWKKNTSLTLQSYCGYHLWTLILPKPLSRRRKVQLPLQAFGNAASQLRSDLARPRGPRWRGMARKHGTFGYGKMVVLSRKNGEFDHGTSVFKRGKWLVDHVDHENFRIYHDFTMKLQIKPSEMEIFFTWKVIQPSWDGNGAIDHNLVEITILSCSNT